MPLDPLQDNPYGHAESWLNIAARLRKGRDELLTYPAAYIYRVNPDLSFEDASTEWISFWKERENPIWHTIEHWIRAKVRLEEPDEMHRWLLLARFDTALDFVRGFVLLGNRESEDLGPLCPFPFPRLEPDEVLEFLLEPWWKGCGTDVFFRRMFEISARREVRLE
jgi:hypothetical protein